MISRNFIDGILDGMLDWVRVVDIENNILFMNKSMREGITGSADSKKCYQVLGKSAPCDFCIARRSIFEGQSFTREEIISGRTYSVTSSPLRDAAGQIVAAVEVLRDVTELKRLQKKISDQNRKLQSDLRMARRLQCSLLPREVEDERMSFSYIYQPCESLGGDFLDIFNIDDHHVGLYIADVSGHGVSASMLTVFLRSTLNKKALSPSTALRKLYREFNKNQSLSHDLYITVFYAVFDLRNLTITFANAGHNVIPFVFGQDRFELLASPGVPISNWVDNPEYTDKTMQLQPNDSVFFFTDGLIEMRNADNEQFGEDRLLDILMSESHSHPVMYINKIMSAAEEFSGGNLDNTSDDITLALIRLKARDTEPYTGEDGPETSVPRGSKQTRHKRYTELPEDEDIARKRSRKHTAARS